MVDGSRLTGGHNWGTDSVDVTEGRYDMHRFLDVRNFRPDMQRLARIAQENEGRATELWRNLRHLHRNLFEIPRYVFCDRTFARDALEAAYVDHIDAFLARVLAGKHVCGWITSLWWPPASR